VTASARLGDVAEFVNGAAFKPSDWSTSGLPIIRIQNLTDPSKPFNRTTRAVADKLRVRPGDLLVSWSATLGVFEWSASEDGLLNQHIFRVLRDESRVHKRYLRWLLVRALDDMQRHMHGATMQHVNRGEFLSTPIYLPALHEQRQIADILDRADALRATRRESLALLDDLTQAVFLDMFGDPATNPKRWQSVVLGELVLSASDGPHVSPKYADAGVPFVSARHVRPGEISWEDLKFITQEDAAVQWRKCRPEFGDVLYTKGGTTGLAAEVTTRQAFAIWVHVALLKLRADRAAPTWLTSMLNTAYCYAQSQHLTHGIANHDLGLKRMLTIRMFAPPLHIQEEFAARARSIRAIRGVAREQAVHLEQAFASLQDRAFRGEL
jgi:type I restriction enzyme, S subunit